MPIFKIEKDVPLPRNQIGRVTKVLEEMEVGDSFEYSNENRSAVNNASCKMNRIPGSSKRFISKKTDGTWRCWRTE